MTTAHSEEDVKKLIGAFRDSLSDMRAGAFVDVVEEPGRVTMARSTGAAAAPAEPATAPAAFPLTEAQQELWLAAQMSGDAAVAYNESLKLEFRGALDLDLFRTAVQQLVQRHPILLAQLSADGASQHIPSDRSIDITLDDLSNYEAQSREQALRQVIDRETSEPFELTTGPLLRLRIVRLSTEHHVVVWTAHHIVCDGWSGGVLIGELARIYSALTQGIAPDLETPTSFEEYARVARASTSETRESLEYWRDRFKELPPPLDLPADRPRPTVRTARASTTKRTIDPAVHHALKQAASQQRVTMVALLMAGLNALMHRLTGQTDLVVGLPISGQALTGQHCLVGHCVSLVPIRTGLGPESSFQEHLQAVKQELLDAYEHRHTTIGTILQHVLVPRDASRPPLIEVIFNVDRDPGAAQFHGVDFTCERNPKRALHYDLFFNFVEGPRGLYVECDYNTDLFAAATIDRWLGHYQTLLAAAAANPTANVAALPLLTEAEQRKLTVEWNRTAAAFPSTATLHGLFEAQVDKTPGAPAVTFEGQQLTYDELNRRANKLAHHLQALGAAPDTIVGLCVARSIEMVVGALAILKAGCAYLPLDITYPADRLAFMLNDSGASLLLTERKVSDRLPSGQAKLVFIEEAQGGPDSNLASPVTARNLCYVIYTSGSTGTPKGVLLEHRGLVNLLCAVRQDPGFSADDVMLSVTTLSFDIATSEVFLPLVCGGRLVIAPEGFAADGARLADLIERSGATFMQPTPATWQALLDADWRGSSKLRMVSTGEPLPLELARRLLPLGAGLWNLYGPTETTIWSTGCRITSLDEPITIGRPIANTQTYILDAHRQPVPIGVSGELYIGGEGLARGYLRRPELTNERFVSSPFAESGGSSRIYRTGDLARYRPDGTIECLGRIDHQVKLRGFRIELGEIEAVLNRQKAVRQCVVMAREDRPGDKMLVAYVESQTGSAPNVSDLRAHLKQTLPDYMVPSAFVLMERLPLTANGKIDRKVLPPPAETRLTSDAQAVAPRDALEQMLSRLWSKVLRVRNVGVQDNFFDLGGHSILAVRVMMEIERRVGKRLPLATLFQAPTIGELAAVLRKNDWKPGWSSLVPIQSGGSRFPLFLMHSHGGNVLEYYPLVSHLDKDQPVYALQARGLDGRIVTGQSMEQMAAAYVQEMKTLQPEGPYFLGGFCLGGLLAMEAAQQLTAAGDEVGLVIMIQTTHPAASRFKPGTTALQRWRYRATKRFDLERELLRQAGTSYFVERGRRLRDVFRSRIALAFNGFRQSPSGQHTNLSMPYVLEALGIEHDRVFEEYVPRPYYGNTVLFRASKQMRGLIADATYLGWQETFGGEFSVYEMPGHQQTMLTGANARHVAHALAEHLRAAQMRCLERGSSDTAGRESIA